jgi:hypothetical protein
MRRTTLACWAALAVAAVLPPAGQGAPPRSTVDRLDDAAGPQVHYVYAVPRGGTDRGLDKKGTIAASIDAQQRWLEGESGGARLRVDTVGGAPDVTFVALPFTIRQLVETDSYRAIRDHLKARGLVKPEKKYVVYYEGPPEQTVCGLSDGDLIGVVYLRSSDCALDQYGIPQLGLAGPGQEPQARDYTALHELIHALGFVAPCARHYDGSGTGLHVTEPRDDLMADGRRGTPKLDPGRDDYFGHGRAGCPDLAKSVYLTTIKAPAAVKPSAALTIRTATASLRGTRLALHAEIDAGGQKATAECHVRIPGAPGSARGTAVIRGNDVECGWQVASFVIQAWKQHQIVLRAEVVVRSAGRVATRTVTVRAP